ncbi:phosphate-starvation-inducible PsiE family protein [Vreelandella venusta]|uniref:phosphate-starvation-inducible PsiE family protein n=1 Tax=Vreelandella venusta TaxID=44935 RepID=UPI00384D541E
MAPENGESRVIARKVIILDISLITAAEMVGIAAIVLALGVTYWLVGKPNSH